MVAMLCYAMLCYTMKSPQPWGNHTYELCYAVLCHGLAITKGSPIIGEPCVFRMSMPDSKSKDDRRAM
eukprot:3539783-Pyramimonas_sp.AAC.1